MCRLLIIDETDAITEKIKKLNSPIISELHYASQISEILAITKTHQLDVIVSDIKLGNIDLFPTLEQIKISCDNSIPIIILTSNSDREKVVSAAKLGTMGYFLKPVEEGVLVEKIKKTVDSFKRQHSARQFVRVRPADKDITDLNFKDPRKGDMVTGTLIDISLGGLGFLQNTEKSYHKLLSHDKVKINLKINNYSLLLPCEVVTSDEMRCNVKFNNISKMYQEILSNYIYQRTSGIL